MPIPKRRKNEEKQAFVTRCMGDKVMNKDYPDNKQRVAICLDQATADCGCVEAADFKMQFDNYGYEEEITEESFYCPTQAEYEDFGEETEEWDIAGEKPGLWDNIRKKKERMGKNYKPAQKGDPDRPDPKSWKEAQSNTNDNELETDASYEYQDTHTGQVYTYKRKGYYEKDGRVLTYMGQASEYQGRKVTLNKPFRTPNGPKKFAVYTKNESGNVIIVRFGDPNMEIKKDIPERRKSFRARMRCDTPGPKWKARYWSCRMW